MDTPATRINLNQMSAQERADYYNANRARLTYTQAKRLIKAIKSDNYSHARFNPTFGGRTLIYHRDATTPTGVRLAAAGSALDVDPLIRRYQHNSPLSPTER